jgi:TrpR family trp operon transcriptional repressor
MSSDHVSVLVNKYDKIKKHMTIKQEKTYLTELNEYLMSANDIESMNQRLIELLTPIELIEISKRLQIIKMLKQGNSQRDIAKQLGVGIATVTRGSHVIKHKYPPSTES